MLIREQIRTLLKISAVAGNGHSGTHARNLVNEISESFSVVSNPEFLKEGSAIKDTFFPDRIVIGSNDQRALDRLTELYRPILDQTFAPPSSISRPRGLRSVPLVTTDLASAEMIKYAANSFLAVKISFANEIANICEQTGADVTRVMHGIGLDQRIGTRFLRAGAGWGGSCFGKDVSALIQMAGEYGYSAELLHAARSVNDRQRHLVIQKLQSALKIIKGRTIGLLGLAFKPNTDDVRDAPSFDIASDLIRLGARVKVYDPVAMRAFRAQHPDLDLIYTPHAQELVTDCDALVIVTDWQEFRALNLDTLCHLMSGSVLIDGRNIFNAREAGEAGFHYIGIGT
jgi:UDPglucose 6-dehydrogenase